MADLILPKEQKKFDRFNRETLIEHNKQLAALAIELGRQNGALRRKQGRGCWLCALGRWVRNER